jgi:hypothetical protein
MGAVPVFAPDRAFRDVVQCQGPQGVEGAITPEPPEERGHRPSLEPAAAIKSGVRACVPKEGGTAGPAERHLVPSFLYSTKDRQR